MTTTSQARILVATFEVIHYLGDPDGLPEDSAQTFDHSTDTCYECGQSIAVHVESLCSGRIVCPGQWLVRRDGSRVWESMTDDEITAATRPPLMGPVEAKAEIAQLRERLATTEAALAAAVRLGVGVTAAYIAAATRPRRIGAICDRRVEPGRVAGHHLP